MCRQKVIMNQYKILDTIENDPPYGNICWYLVSFLSPNKLVDLGSLDLKGIKIHNGYRSLETLKEEIAAVKAACPNHDVFVAEMGKIYPWDDFHRTQDVIYENNKLTSMEKSRREDLDTLKLLQQQKISDIKRNQNNDTTRALAKRRRFLKRLHDKGQISKLEMDMVLEDKNKEERVVQDNQQRIKEIEALAEEVKDTDYLDENKPVGLRYGCFTIYSPKNIHNLAQLCFKVRYLDRDLNVVRQKALELKASYPNDNIYICEVGKWTAFSEKTNGGVDDPLTVLNYCMKRHIDHIKTQNEEFSKRKAEKLEEAKIVSDPLTMNQEDTSTDDVKEAPLSDTPLPGYGSAKDRADVDALAKWLSVPGLVNKYSTKDMALTSSIIDVN